MVIIWVVKIFFVHFFCIFLLDLLDRVPDELWTEVCDIVQETGIKTISMEKKGKKAKWQSGRPYK